MSSLIIQFFFKITQCCEICMLNSRTKGTFENLSAKGTHTTVLNLPIKHSYLSTGLGYLKRRCSRFQFSIFIFHFTREYFVLCIHVHILLYVHLCSVQFNYSLLQTCFSKLQVHLLTWFQYTFRINYKDNGKLR